MKATAATGIKAIASGRKDIYRIDPRLLNIEDGFNARIDYSGGEELREFIRQNGVPGIYKIYTKNEKYYIKDGHRRQREVLALIEEGLEIKTVDCVHEKETDEERVFGLLSSNEGKPFSQREKGIIYLRLMNYGWSQTEIAAKIGKSQSLVSNAILLARAPKKVQKLMDSNLVPDSTVLSAMVALKEIPDATDDTLVEIITKSAAEAKEVGEGRSGAARRVRERVGRPMITPATRVKELGQFVEENSIVLKDNDRYKGVQSVYAFMKGDITIADLLARIS